MTDHDQTQYASLLLSAVDLQPGQPLFIQFEPVIWPTVVTLTREAYKRGARYVEPAPSHPDLTAIRASHSYPEFLDHVPGFRSSMVKTLVEEKWARISLSGPEDPDVLASVDPGNVARIRKAFAAVDRPMRRAVQADHVRWVVSAVPTPGWAAKVFDCEPSAEAAERLWQVLRPIMKFDQADPFAAWKAHSDLLNERCRKLEQVGLDSLQFTGPGTELTVGLPPGAIWIGGGSNASDGRWFLANLPTEEVFTTPDWRRTTGRVRLTRPALIGGRPVYGASFEFKDGEVVSWHADQGSETLSRLFETDSGARRLGEVALVDGRSSIFRSGLVFHNTLLDENAASHIAFGSAYPGGVPGGNEMDDDELARAGVNTSLIHSDVMIGSPDVDIAGITRSGSKIALITGGNWQI